ncbi:MAG: diguanylate cyclase [Burkholderiales bacterium]|nr:diguanylate cyclase [Burkholderiales bacterium]
MKSIMGPTMDAVSPFAPRTLCFYGVRVWLLMLWVWALPWAHAGQNPAGDVVNVQLRWHHQFQFAGYYAALEKGFYRDEGLTVRLHAGAPDRQPVDEVLAGRAQYAEGNSEVLLQRLLGKPLVAMAAIFQHSPSVLLVRRDSGIASPHDLIGKKVMLMNGVGDADFISMLQNEGVAPHRLTVLPSSFNFDDLLTGKVDAFNSYLTNEPYYLQQKGIDYTVINPRNYRVDFYSDILFTSENELRNNPARVEAMRRATLKGWRYAMDHPAEIIDLLLNKYQVEKTRAHLEFEANAVRELILPDLVEIGHMNQGRWEHMAQTFLKAGMVQAGFSLDGFMMDSAPQPLPSWVLPALMGALGVSVMALGAVWWVYRVNRQLVVADNELRAVNQALQASLSENMGLQSLLQEKAIRDALTGLYNRRYLDEMLERELARAKREGYPLSVAMLDLDHFKAVNDTYGHLAGDEVLKNLARYLQASAREGDISCRFGGEEFVMVLPGLTVADACRRLEQWRTDFAGAVTRHGTLEIRVTMSIGLAVFPDHAASVEGLLQCADKALYRAKNAGRNRLEVGA